VGNHSPTPPQTAIDETGSGRISIYEVAQFNGMLLARNADRIVVIGREDDTVRMMKWMILLVCLAAAAEAEFSADAIDVNDPDRQHAFQLYNQHNMPEAADLLEKFVAKHPTDVAAQEAFGVALVGRAETQTDAEKARADRLAARRALLRAKELGDTSDLCRILLAQIPETGEPTLLATKPEVDAALKVGEAAFAKGSWQEAIAAYTAAWDLDHNWRAALYLGDTYYATQEMQRAGEWFTRAIELEPDREQAYRYWGDALLKQGKMKEARLKYIGGVIAEPYNAASLAGLRKWLTQNKLALKKISITLPPGPLVDESGKTSINIDASMLAKPDAGVAWIGYSTMRATFRKDQFPKIFPQATTYRHSLAEEEYALSSVVLIYRETSKNKPKSKDPSLDLLAKFEEEEMLAPFVLLTHADEGIAEDYNAYRAAHRDRLIAFLDRYLVPPAP
jgi:tetratricopeptide (TPR) repeat protein